MSEQEMREKVIKSMQSCLKRNGCDCIYFPADDCKEAMMLDALELLKAQEPMLVKYTISTIRCPKCNKQITSRGAIHNEINFCWKCGQAVKWE